MFYLADKTANLSLKLASQIILRDCFEEVKGEDRRSVSFCCTNQWWEHEKITVKKLDISSFSEFSAFLCLGGCKSLGSLKSFL